MSDQNQFGTRQNNSTERAVDAAADTAQEKTEETVERIRERLRQADAKVADGTSAAAESVSSAVSSGTGRAEHAVAAAGDAVSGAVDSARSTASNAVDAARTTANQLGSQASDKIDSALTTAGSQMGDLAHTIRERAPEGKVGEIAANTADTLERGSEYLRDADLESLTSDLSTIIRQRPIAALVVGIGIGYLLARATN